MSGKNAKFGTATRRTILRNGAILAAVGVVGVEPVLAYDFPSTNEDNRKNGFPHVNRVDDGPNNVTLEFVNDTNSLACFEYRIDGRQAGGRPHPVVEGDVIHPTVCLDGRGVDEELTETRTFGAREDVGVRLALGGERDWDFDWTPFSVGER